MNILLVDDDTISRQSVSKFLRKSGHTVIEAFSGEEAVAIYNTADFPMVLSDICMPGMSGVDLLRTISRLPSGAHTDIVLFTGHGSMETAIEALRMGAFDYLLKPININELSIIVEKIAEHQSLRRENTRLTAEFEKEVAVQTEESRREVLKLRKLLAKAYNEGNLSAFSDSMKEICRQAELYHADPGIPVLIEGETGTGKELIARLIHYGNMESTTPFVDVNCAAITSNLFESELFGYEGGSYTGSLHRGQKGKIDLADGGSLFLDEIGETSLDIQAKLLRVLQEKEYYRVGGLKKIKANARIICATNMDLKRAVDQGSFRADLFYRLNVGYIYIPPLRQRREAILPLANTFLQKFCQERGKKFRTISNKAAQLLMKYSWPGNVRELRNEIEWSVFMYDEEQLLPEHLKFGSHSTPVPVSGNLPFALPRDGFSIDGLIDEIVGEAVAMHGGNLSAAAAYLKTSRRVVSYRVEKIKQNLDQGETY